MCTLTFVKDAHFLFPVRVAVILLLVATCRPDPQAGMPDSWVPLGGGGEGRPAANVLTAMCPQREIFLLLEQHGWET